MISAATSGHLESLPLNLLMVSRHCPINIPWGRYLKFQGEGVPLASGQLFFSEISKINYQ